MNDGILTALAEGRERLGGASLLIPCILRHLPEDEGFATFREAELYVADRRIASLDSTEKDSLPDKFRRFFTTDKLASSWSPMPVGKTRGRLMPPTRWTC